MPRSWVVALKEWKAVVPILSISLSADNRGKLLDLLRSIDFPVKRILIQVGHPNATVINRVMHSVHALAAEMPKYLKSAIELKRLRVFPGTAQGYNHGLRAMMSTEAEWALIVRPGTVFEPNALKKLAAHVAQHLQTDPLKFGVGFSAGESDAWSSFALTRRLVQKVGYFDENFYPSGKEGADYANRVRLGGFYGKKLRDVRTSREEVEAEVAELEEMSRRATSGGAAAEYFSRKWGEGAECADLAAVATCPSHRSPFNEESKKLREWSMEPHRREWIISGKGTLADAVSRDKESGGAYAALGLGWQRKQV